MERPASSYIPGDETGCFLLEPNSRVRILDLVLSSVTLVGLTTGRGVDMVAVRRANDNGMLERNFCEGMVVGDILV